jgi:hypothetical protein
MNSASQATPARPGQADQWIRRTVTVPGLAWIADALGVADDEQGVRIYLVTGRLGTETLVLVTPPAAVHEEVINSV